MFYTALDHAGLPLASTACTVPADSVGEARAGLRLLLADRPMLLARWQDEGQRLGISERGNSPLRVLPPDIPNAADLLSTLATMPRDHLVLRLTHQGHFSRNYVSALFYVGPPAMLPYPIEHTCGSLLQLLAEWDWELLTTPALLPALMQVGETQALAQRRYGPHLWHWTLDWWPAVAWPPDRAIDLTATPDLAAEELWLLVGVPQWFADADRREAALTPPYL